MARPRRSVDPSQLSLLDLLDRQRSAGDELRAFLAAETFAKQHPQRAKAAVARAFAIGGPALDRLWPWLDLRVRLSQSLLLAMEDQARWAVEGRWVENVAMPNYLKFVRLDAMLSVKPSAVSVIR